MTSETFVKSKESEPACCASAGPFTFCHLIGVALTTFLLTFLLISSSNNVSSRPYNASQLAQARDAGNGVVEWPIVAITDLDTESKDASGKKWHSNGRNGVLQFNAAKRSAKVTWSADNFQITSQLANGGRAMELSDLAVFDGHLLTVDDRTGIVYHLKGSNVIPWVLLNDGPGNTAKTLKGEWMTVKDEQLIVGGLGKEWTTTTGEYVNDNPMWVKFISKDGAVNHVNWKDVFIKVRRAIGIEYPGYMIHESVQWSPVHKKWFFLPRRASKEMYSEEPDETRGVNILIIASEKFDSFEAVEIGKHDDSRRGFSAFQFIPSTQDNIIIALKSAEKDGIPVASYVTVFDIKGNILLDDQQLPDAFKYEGIAFA